MFILGFILGYIVSLTVVAVVYAVTSKNRSAIIRGIDSFTTTPVFNSREKMSIIKRKTPAEEAYEHVKSLNTDRGGIPDSEL